MNELKTRFEYIHFCPVEGSGRSRWLCYNNRAGSLLGDVIWYHPWRCYNFQPSASAEFSSSCLRDIAAFMDAVKKTEAGR